MEAKKPRHDPENRHSEPIVDNLYVLALIHPSLMTLCPILIHKFKRHGEERSVQEAFESPRALVTLRPDCEPTHAYGCAVQ